MSWSPAFEMAGRYNNRTGVWRCTDRMADDGTGRYSQPSRHTGVLAGWELCVRYLCRCGLLPFSFWAWCSSSLWGNSLRQFVSAAIAFWSVALLTWVYDQGWVNPLARVPGVSGVLGLLANRKALSGPDTGTSAERTVAPPGELDESERRALFATAQQTFASLQGNEAAKEFALQHIVAPAGENPDNPFGYNAPATIVFVSGPHRGRQDHSCSHTVQPARGRRRGQDRQDRNRASNRPASGGIFFGHSACAQQDARGEGRHTSSRRRRLASGRRR